MGKKLCRMSSNSRLSSLTACPVSHPPAHTPILQPPPSPFLLFNGTQPLHRPQTLAATDTETTSRPLSPSQPGFATNNGNFSHLDVPKTPVTVANQPSCPSAPKRQPPLRLYGGHSTVDSGGSTKSAQLSTGNNRDQRRHPPAATDDTAASLRQLLADAEAVSSPQDMLHRLRSDTWRLAPTEAAAVSEVSMPVPAMLMSGCLGTYESPSALRAKRLKLFGQARSSFLTTDCIQSSSTAVLLPAQSQRRPLTAHTDPPTVQTDPPTALSDCTAYARCQTSGLPGGALALRTQSEPEFSHSHQVYRSQLPTDRRGTQAGLASSLLFLAPDSPHGSTDGSATMSAPASAPASASRGGPDAQMEAASPCGEGQS